MDKSVYNFGKLIFKFIKIVLLSMVTAIGTGIIINIVAFIFTAGRGLSNSISVAILVISFIVWIILYWVMDYRDKNCDEKAVLINQLDVHEGERGIRNISVVHNSDRSVDAEESSGYNGPKTLPIGCYEPFFDLNHDGKMSEYETYLQWENEQHIKNDTPNQFWN